MGVLATEAQKATYQSRLHKGGASGSSAVSLRLDMADLAF